jgi:hypothetical protein
MTLASPPQLEYGLAPPRRRKRLVRAMIGGIAVLVGLAAWQWGSVVWNQFPILFWQRQCLRYTASADQVVYEEDPTEVPRLLSRGYVRYKLSRGASPDPTPTNTFAAAAQLPNCWRRLTALVPPPVPQQGASSGAMLFLHERISPRGNRRLVCVRYYAETYSFTASFIEAYNVDDNVIVPGTWTSLPAWTAHPMMIDVISSWPRLPPRVRVHAGQVDPDDATHFTIRYQMWGKEDVLDGRLDDSDRVTLTPRKVPRDDSR